MKNSENIDPKIIGLLEESEAFCRVKMLKKQFYNESTNILQNIDKLCGTMVKEGGSTHTVGLIQLFV